MSGYCEVSLLLVNKLFELGECVIGYSLSNTSEELEVVMVIMPKNRTARNYVYKTLCPYNSFVKFHNKKKIGFGINGLLCNRLFSHCKCTCAKLSRSTLSP